MTSFVYFQNDDLLRFNKCGAYQKLFFTPKIY
jgi:hypothetical protein